VAKLQAMHEVSSEYLYYTAKQKQDYIYNRLIIAQERSNFLPEYINKTDKTPSRVAKINFKIISPKYSGIFSSGTLGFIKISNRTKIKFLIDECPPVTLEISDRFLVNNNFDISQQELYKNLYSDLPEHQINKLAMRISNGRLVLDTNIPKLLIFETPPARGELTKFKKDVILYHVYDHQEHYLADVILESDFLDKI
jgi:hypothetical protein